MKHRQWLLPTTSILHSDVKNQKCPTSKIREVWKTTFTFLNVFYIFLNFYVGAVGLNRSPSLKLLLYKFYLNQAAARAHFSPKKCTRHKKSKSHFSNFSNFWPSTFFKIKKISELCRCNSHLAVSDDSYYCIFSVLHMDTKNDPFLSRPSMFVCPTNFFLWQETSQSLGLDTYSLDRYHLDSLLLGSQYSSRFSTGTIQFLCWIYRQNHN